MIHKLDIEIASEEPMAPRTDIEIARAARKLPIQQQVAGVHPGSFSISLASVSFRSPPSPGGFSSVAMP